MHKIIRIWLFVSCAILSSSISYAQDNCDRSLLDATNYYDNGNITLCISTLQSCLSEFRSELEKIEAYRLLAICYFDLHDDDKVEQYVQQLLKTKPNYLLSSRSRDSKEFTSYLAQYNVMPNLSIGISAGASINSVSIMKNNLAYTTAHSEYKPSVKYFFLVNLDKNIAQHSILRGSLGLRGSGIDQLITISPNTEQTYNEQIDFVDLKLGYAYRIQLNNDLQLDLDLGFGLAQLYKSQMYLALIDKENRSVVQSSNNGIYQKQRLQPNMNTGVAFRKKFYSGTLGLGIHYLYNLTPNTKDDKVYNNLSFNFDTHYVHDVLKINSFLLSFSYSTPLSYKIIKPKSSINQ